MPKYNIILVDENGRSIIGSSITTVTNKNVIENVAKSHMENFSKDKNEQKAIKYIITQVAK